MTEWIKTTIYVGVAAATIGLAFAAEWATRPVVSQEFEMVGEVFYPEFDNPLAARSLEVVSYSPETSVIHTFHVDWGENGWSISPYGYPVDAEDTLEKVAASVVGITRTALASRLESDHERFGVVDPRNKDAQLSERGKRIALKDENGQILVDLIIGDPVEGREGYYYVRKPKEDETYIAKVDLELSTRFADWIDSDLLKISAGDLKKIQIFDYSLNQQTGRAEMRGQSVLVKTDQFSPWTLKGLDTQTKQLNTTAVNDLTSVLDNLKIIGVRPKPEGLGADLSLDPQVISNQLAFDLLRQNLADKGFYFAQDSQGNLQIVGKEGQLIATTTDGIAFDLYFGEQFSGSRYEIEFGQAEEGEAPVKLDTGESENAGGETADQKQTDAEEANQAEGQDKDGPEQQDSDTVQTGRYVFIAARFVPEATGTPPEAPKPVAEDATEEEKKAAEKAQQEYETAKKKYEKKVADAKKRVEELNARFENWYYVISTENFQNLRLSRKALVEPKEKKPEESAGQKATSAANPASPPKPDSPSKPTSDAKPSDQPQPPASVTAPKPAMAE